MRVYLDMIGCRLNQSEIETFARQFRMAGHQIVADPSLADLAVVNTCAVTASAESDSRQKIRQITRAGAGKVIVTGCWSSLDPEGAAKLPGVVKVIHNKDKDALVPSILDVPQELFDLEPNARQPLPGVRSRTRAFIKVQDGCDNRCTFCVTTIARGKGRSRSVAEVLFDIQTALAPDQNPVKEVVLTGVHLGSWGLDLRPRKHLSDLIRIILERTDVPRLRLSSLEPWDLDADFFSLWKDTRLCRHLHLPLQSGCAATLRRMARKTTPESFADLLAAARKSCQDIAITTDIIVGFPGESEAEFQESLAFVRSMNFSGGHVFTYSARPGTAAARMPDQVPHPLRKERNRQMKTILSETARAYQERFLGHTLPVLWESASAIDGSGWYLQGWTDNYLRVSTYALRSHWNQITDALLTAIQGDVIRGQIPV
jgi:threonylcarbamoyladenosine tRNA methylthiotransferase MtaB